MRRAVVEINEFKSMNLSGYTLIEGFPGLGLVGTISAKHLVEKLKMDKYGFISSNAFTPIIRIREGKPVYPSRMFISKKKKLVVMISEQAIPKEFTYDFTRVIVEWIKKKKIAKVISLNGITSNEEIDKIYGYASSDEGIKFLKKNNIEIINEGITTGISALMMLELKTSDATAMALLSPVKLAADYAASAKLITKLNEIYSLNLDIKPLMEEAKKVESELTGYIEKLKSEQEKQKTNQAFHETPSYT